MLNISSSHRPKRRVQRLLALLCAASLLVPAAPTVVVAQSRLPALGESASDDLSIGSERRLGDQIMRNIRRDPDYLDDPVLLEYLQSLWDPLVAAARQRGDIGPDLEQRFAWEAFLVRDRSVNAFALPGGYVGVHLGLIAMTSTRDELASVLAHELTHVSQRHIARSMANSARQSMIGMVTMILGMVAASRSTRMDGANALITGGQAVAAQGQLNFSRDAEREADRIGFSVLTQAGYAPGGMAAMFEKLENNSRLNDSGGFPYLRTHPLNAERIGEARARQGASSAAAPVGVLAHAAAQARAKVMMDTRIDALRRWQALEAPAGAPPAERLLAAYASALASTLLRDWSRADTALPIAVAAARGDARAQRDVALLQAQSLLARGDTERAGEVLQPFAKSDGQPSSRAVMLLAAQVATPRDKAALQRSAEELQTWASLHPHDATVWSQLGRTWEKLDQPLRALRAEAESRIALGDLMGGVDRLRAGQRLARSSRSTDFIEASVIDARLKEIEAQARRREAEDRQREG
ncbi:M48 family metalloprotease [Piscinibacter sp. HJYY11]|uniref:M48 family metalloprotease n=1 Tax=Piscinibacter sp. HJYY11 TaxID=2801333 RepID=UPI001F011289|nr:M48 family metalloprotease [Piscinibacter sp. HJYY11]